jgi:hypothetical protein
MELYEKVTQWLKVGIALVMLLWLWQISSTLDKILEALSK